MKGIIPYVSKIAINVNELRSPFKRWLKLVKPKILSVINSRKARRIMGGNFHILPSTHPYCLVFQNKNVLLCYIIRNAFFKKEPETL